MTSPDVAGTPQEVGQGKPKKWMHSGGGEVPTFTLPNALVAEVMGALGLAYDATAADYVNLALDHTTGGLKVYVAGQAGGGSAVTIVDGGAVTIGTTTDAAVVSDTSGTVIGFLRGLVKLFAARVPVLGQSTKSGSTPVTIASDQGAVSVTATNSFALDATLTGGTAKSKLVDTGGTNVAVVDSSGALSQNMTKVGSTAVDTNSGTKSAGTQRIVLATDQPQLTNALKVDPSAVTSPVSIATAPVLVAGTAEIGRVGLSKTGTGFTGYLLATLTSVATVSGAAGKLAGGSVINLNTVPVYLQVFDTTGAVSLGTTVPTITIPIPANATAANGVATNLSAALGDVGLAIANGIKIAATTGPKNITTVTTGLEGFLIYA